MFESLTEKLNGIFYKLGNRGKLGEKDIDNALREVRLALLEADVNFKVVKDFVSRVRERSIGAEVQQSLTPAQQIIKIVNEELVATLGETQSQLVGGGNPPYVLMLVGLQGGGKTTTSAKLALHLRHNGQRPLLVAADNRRPAAIEHTAAGNLCSRSKQGQGDSRQLGYSGHGGPSTGRRGTDGGAGIAEKKAKAERSVAGGGCHDRTGCRADSQ